MNRIIKFYFFILLFNCSENQKKLKNNNVYRKLYEESESLKIDINKYNSINFINKEENTLISLNKKLKRLEKKLKKIFKATFQNPRLIFILTHKLIKLDIEKNICEISSKNKYLNKEITKIIFEYYLDINPNFEIKDEIIKDKNGICEKIKVLNYPLEKKFHENENSKSIYIFKNPSSLFELNFIENKSIDSFYYELKYYYFNCCPSNYCCTCCCSKEELRASYKIFWGLEDIKENILFKENLLNIICRKDLKITPAYQLDFPVLKTNKILCWEPNVKYKKRNFVNRNNNLLDQTFAIFYEILIVSLLLFFLLSLTSLGSYVLNLFIKNYRYIAYYWTGVLILDAFVLLLFVIKFFPKIHRKFMNSLVKKLEDIDL